MEYKMITDRRHFFPIDRLTGRCYCSAFNKLRKVVPIGEMQNYKLTSLFNLYFEEYILMSPSDHKLVID